MYKVIKMEKFSGTEGFPKNAQEREFPEYYYEKFPKLRKKFDNEDEAFKLKLKLDEFESKSNICRGIKEDGQLRVVFFDPDYYEKSGRNNNLYHFWYEVKKVD